MVKYLKSHIFKTFIAFSIFFTNTKFFWFILKIINLITFGKIKSLFIFYASKKSHFGYYLYPWVEKRTKWKIFFCGIHKQRDGWGLNFAINAHESQIISDKNKEIFKKFLELNIKRKKFIRARYVNYAGILPSIINKRKLNSYQSGNKEVVAEIVSNAIFEISENHDLLDKGYDLLIIGGNGYIGREIVKFLNKRKIKPFIIEIGDIENFRNLINNNDRTKVILDVSRRGVLVDYGYANFLNKNCILLNEVFPDPDLTEFDLQAGYHLKGIDAFVFPALPNGYDRSLPCCALIKESIKFDYKISIKKIK